MRLAETANTLPDTHQQTTAELPPLREVMAQFGLSPKKSLGQNFLLDINLTRRIARSGESLSEKTVVEIGPGPGGLTRALLLEGAKHVLAIEADERCALALQPLADAFPGRLTVVTADALKADIGGLLEKLHTTDYRNVAIVANLPYNIGTALLVQWLSQAEWPPWFSSATLLFQREVAERITARPNTKDYGRLSVLAQWRTNPRKLFDIAPSAFIPPPKVTSTLVHLEVLNRPTHSAVLQHLEAVTAAAFGQRRKMLRQSLKPLGISSEALLEAAQIDGMLRAEALSVADFCALARAYGDLKSARP